MCNLENKNVLITGSSRGIGRDIAIELAKLGANIAIHYTAKKDAALAARQEVIDLGRSCCIIKADLREINSSEIIFNEVAANLGHIDILVLNASIQYRKNWMDITAIDFEEQFNCNLRSSIFLLQKCIPGMLKKKWGRIITIGSIHEKKYNSDMLVYAATKNAQTLVGSSLAFDFAKDGITINNIAPGVIMTDRNKGSLNNTETYEMVLSKVPMGYFGNPVDCTGAVSLLCSDAGKYITGQSIFIDGGMSLK